MPGRRYKRKPGSRKYIDYSKCLLDKAVDAVRNGMPLRNAEELFGIPHATLARKNKLQNMGTVGRPTVLSKAEEDVIVSSISMCAAWGFPLTALDVRYIVKAHLDRLGINESRFKDNMPGRYWMEHFMYRHKDVLSSRLCDNIKRARAAVSPEIINTYFDNLKISIEHVRTDAMINYDETNMSDDPGRKKVFIKRGSKHVANVMDSSKSSISVMFCGTASGILLPPYIVYRAEHLYDSWTEGGPAGTVYNKTRRGWFNTVTFEDFFFKIVVPYFDRLGDRPKLLIGDNVSSHLSVPVIKTCIEKNIRFVCFPSNSTHLCQPLDLSVFRSLKGKWREILMDWKMHNRGCISKDVFPRLLKRALSDTTAISCNLISGFKAAGISPLNKNEVLKKLPNTDSTEQNIGPEWIASFQDFLKENRFQQNTPVRQRKKKVQSQPGQGLTNEDVQDILNNENEKKKNTKKKPTKTPRFQEIIQNDEDFEDFIDEDNICDPLLVSADRTAETHINDSDTTFTDDEFSIHDTSDEVGNDTEDEHWHNFINKRNEIDINREGTSGENTMIKNKRQGENTKDKENMKNYVSRKVVSEKGDKSNDNSTFSVEEFVQVELIYNENKKKITKKTFIAQIVEINEPQTSFTCKFLRNMNKSKNIYVFPNVDDIMVIDRHQIIKCVRPIQEKRGRYMF